MKLNRILSFALALMLLMGAMTVPALADAVSVNPLLDPQPITGYTETEDEFIHVLIMGVDLGFAGYWGSGGKKDLMECHTDGFMVISFNLTKNRVDFVSIPRDTLTYVPGVQGIYKLNAAFNCAETPEEGIQHCLDAASRMLGGIEIKHYMLVDMGAMIELGKALGGVDFNLDMNYTGMNGVKYRKGQQHLDGNGIMEYVRARRNATVDANDLGRTRRQRDMMISVFKKVQKNTDLIPGLFDVVHDEKLNIFTNITEEDVNSLLPFVTAIEEDQIGSHVMTGNYRFALVDWNFTFTDQAHRLGVLKEVYQLDAEEIPFVSLAYTKWLVDSGFTTVRTIKRARLVMEYGKSLENLSEKQQKILDELIAAHDATVAAFDQAASTLETKDNDAMVKVRRELRNIGPEAAEVLGYPENIAWGSSPLWYVDPMMNEYPDVDWH